MSNDVSTTGDSIRGMPLEIYVTRLEVNVKSAQSCSRSRGLREREKVESVNRA